MSVTAENGVCVRVRCERKMWRKWEKSIVTFKIDNKIKKNICIWYKRKVELPCNYPNMCIYD